jgi:isoquinoline 1-oxidoreductase beta subunit
MNANMNINLTRRLFLLTTTSAAGGLMIGIGASPGVAEAATVVAQPWNEDNAYAANEIDAWVAIDPDDSVLIRYQRAEMGQGSMTAVPMMLNEELQADWSTAACSRTAAVRSAPRKNWCSRSAPAAANA